MYVLGVETSCDETAAAVVRDGSEVLANVVSSQIAKHSGFGGVVPELAAREHLKAVDPVVGTALREAGLTRTDLAAVAVTNGPGLVPALLVGGSYAKGLAAGLDIPLIGINHFLAHIYGAFLPCADMLQADATYPILALVVSGGHTALVLVHADGRAETIGATLDDAAGEAFDKAAKILDLGYPGGPVIDRLAADGNPDAYDFPRGLTGGGGKPVEPKLRHSFSFSGVKTALLYAVKDRALSDRDVRDVAASYQRAIVDVLVSKSVAAVEEYAVPTFCLCGGVACNRELRQTTAAALAGKHCNVVISEPRYCTDNAAMVAGLAYHYLQAGAVGSLEIPVSARLPRDLGAVPFAPGCRCGSAEST